MEKDASTQNINLHVFCLFHRGRTSAKTSRRRKWDTSSRQWWVNMKVTPRRRRWLENVSCHMLLLCWVKKFESHIRKLKRMVWQIPWRKTQSQAKHICTYSDQLHKMNCVHISTYIYSVHCRIEEDQVPKQVGGRPRQNTKTWKRSEEWNKYAKIIRTRVSVRALVQ